MSVDPFGNVPWFFVGLVARPMGYVAKEMFRSVDYLMIQGYRRFASEEAATRVERQIREDQKYVDLGVDIGVGTVQIVSSFGDAYTSSTQAHTSLEGLTAALKWMKAWLRTIYVPLKITGVRQGFFEAQPVEGAEPAEMMEKLPKK